MLDPPEPVHGARRSTRQRYGVIVSSAARAAACCCRDVEGIDTADDQLHVALRKGGIAPAEPYRSSASPSTR